MSPEKHVLHSVTASALLYPIIGNNVIPFAIAVVLIDLDHIIEYVLDTGLWNPRCFFIYHDFLVENLEQNYLGLNLFHTIECYLVLFFLGNSYPAFHYVLFGFLFHLCFDQWALTREYKKPFARAFSIVEYVLRKKTGKYKTSVKDILEKDNINIDKANNLKKFLINWDLARK